MMLLPFLLGGMGGNGSGISSDALMNMLKSSGNTNPMMLMLMSMMSGKNKAAPKNEEQSAGNQANGGAEQSRNFDISKLFGNDVANVLKLFMSQKENGGSAV
jgi:hypothetical protein